MRELKFRVWNKKSKKWASHLEVFLGDGYAGIDEQVEDFGCIVQQYTGFKDINNKEIYEGDIGIYHCPDIVIMKYPEEECEIIWKKNGWHVRHKNNLFLWVIDENFCAKSFEIVGNICENQELLKL